MDAPPIYVNNAGTSWPKAPGVFAAASEALAAGPAESAHILEGARSELCLLLGIRQPERLLLTASCTAALAIAIGDLPWQPGDVVLTSALEHHALLRPILQLTGTHGVVHEVAPYAPGDPLDLECARRVLRRGRVRLVACSGASSITGELLPVAALAQLAHAHGALFLLDAAQTLGVVPLSLDALAIDLMAFAGHKGPLAPLGIGGLWAAPHVRFASPRALCEVDPQGRRCGDFPTACDAGSLDVAAAAGLAAALRWHRTQGSAPGERACALRARLHQALQDRPGCQVFGGSTGPHTGALSLRLDGLPVAEAEQRFAARGIALRAGQHCAPLALQAVGAPEGTVRISFGAFNTERELQAVLDAVDAIIDTGAS